MNASEDILDIPAPKADARVSYGSNKHQFGELRLPTGAKPHPVVVGIHGGYYRALYGLGYFGHVCAALTAAGYATWNIEYRRLGNRGGGWPGTFEDVAAAADHLRVLADTYPLDLTHVITVGHSAGGHLACWLAARHRLAATQPLYNESPLPLKGVVSLAGVLNLRRAWELRLSSGVVRQVLDGTPDQQPERYNSASPFELLPLGVPQYLIHGTNDKSVPYELSAAYAAKARQQGDTVELITLDNVGHFEIVDPRTIEWLSVMTAVRKAVGVSKA